MLSRHLTKQFQRASIASTSLRNGRLFSTEEVGFTAKKEKFPKPLKTRKYGIDILHDPLWNKSLAFEMSERDRLGLRGLLPPVVRSLEAQIITNIEKIRSLPDDVSKNLYLQDLHNRNETLYHRILIEYVRNLSHYPVLVGKYIFNRLRKSRLWFILPL